MRCRQPSGGGRHLRHGAVGGIGGHARAGEAAGGQAGAAGAGRSGGGRVCSAPCDRGHRGLPGGPVAKQASRADSLRWSGGVARGRQRRWHARGRGGPWSWWCVDRFVKQTVHHSFACSTHTCNRCYHLREQAPSDQRQSATFDYWLDPKAKFRLKLKLKHVHARLCRWHSGGECLPPRTRHLQVVCLCNGSRHGAPTDRARLRLLHDARPRPSQHVHVLVVAAGTRVESACRQAPGTCRWFGFATEAAMELRLIEQACGCSMMRGRG